VICVLLLLSRYISTKPLGKFSFIDTVYF